MRALGALGKRAEIFDPQMAFARLPAVVRRARGAFSARTTPEEHLLRSMSARTTEARAKYAKLGLSSRSPLDRTTQALLLRQLYLAHFEARRFEKAREIATQMVELDVLADVARQDAARACFALDDHEAALGHLRLAARHGPAHRRAFHLWTLGSLLFLLGRYEEAAGVLARALRWGTTDKPLYRAHSTLARLAAGERPRSVPRIIDELAAAPCGQGYGRFVLGLLCARAGRRDEAIAYLEAFVRRTTSEKPRLAVALERELAMARDELARLQAN